MGERAKNEYFPDKVTAPGETLRELLQERSVPQSELATRMGRPVKTISEIVNGKAAITPETALQLELVLGVPASFWTQREQHYREYLARIQQSVELRRHVQWAEGLPYRSLQELGLVPPTRSPLERLTRLLEFFGVASPDQWREWNRGLRVAFRMSTSLDANEYALSAWLRAGVLASERIDCAQYEEGRFISVLREARGLTREPPRVFQPELTRACAGAGVAVVLVPELPGSRASGATRWIGSRKAIVQLSLRYRTDDHLWFTFFHEAAHILCHARRSIFIEANGHGGEDESEANRWAADFLIPPTRFAELQLLRRYSKEQLRSFAADLGVAPGIVVGRLQHEGLLPHTHCNDLKQRFRWVSEPASGARD
jgi:HTH-type transcriptional regulator / antitoxin HigA